MSGRGIDVTENSDKRLSQLRGKELRGLLHSNWWIYEHWYPAFPCLLTALSAFLFVRKRHGICYLAIAHCFNSFSCKDFRLLSRHFRRVRQKRALHFSNLFKGRCHKMEKKMINGNVIKMVSKNVIKRKAVLEIWQSGQELWNPRPKRPQLLLWAAEKLSANVRSPVWVERVLSAY